MPPKGIRTPWDLKMQPQELLEKADSLIARIRKAYDQVGGLKPEEINFESVLKLLKMGIPSNLTLATFLETKMYDTLADVECDYTSSRYQLDFPQQVVTDKALRDASTEADKKLQEFDVETSMRPDIFNNLLELQQKNPEMEPEYQRYLERLIKLGKRNGLHLPQTVQDEIRNLKFRINELSIQFHKNLNEDSTKLDLAEQELEGLPSEFIHSLELQEDGKRVVTLKYPHYFPIMRKAKNPATRQRLEHAFDSQCIKENTPILEELVSLRQKQAELLGFPTHAAYITDLRMAKSPEKVRNFLTELASKLAPMWKKEEAYLLELKEKDCKELGLEYDGKLNMYDLRYYTTKVEEIQFSVDQNQLRKYFPLQALTQRLLDIYQLVLGLQFAEQEGAEVWHPDVRMFSVSDSTSGELLGYFFMDLFPREGKYNHAAMFELQPGCLLPDGSRQVAVAALVANFTNLDDKPLLDHTEVTTFFHEFGHVMHQICAQAKLSHFNGTNGGEGLHRSPFPDAGELVLGGGEPPVDVLPPRGQLPHPGVPAGAPDPLPLANCAYHNIRQIVLALFDLEIHTRGTVLLHPVMITSVKMPPKGIRTPWDLKMQPQELLEKADTLIARIRKSYDQVGALKPEEINFESVLKTLADVECDYTSSRYQLDFPQQVVTDKALRDASTEADKKLQEFDVETSMRPDIFNNLLELQQKNPEMDPEYQRYLERLIKLGKRN
ncbi:THOP1, partial [Cordylochernes scorpioides]